MRILRGQGGGRVEFGYDEAIKAMSTKTCPKKRQIERSYDE